MLQTLTADSAENGPKQHQQRAAPPQGPAAAAWAAAHLAVDVPAAAAAAVAAAAAAAAPVGVDAGSGEVAFESAVAADVHSVC